MNEQPTLTFLQRQLEATSGKLWPFQFWPPILQRRIWLGWSRCRLNNRDEELHALICMRVWFLSHDIQYACSNILHLQTTFLRSCFSVGF